MKVLSIVVGLSVAILGWLTPVGADSRISYRIKGSIEFDGYGPVPSNQVCLDGNMLVATVPSHNEVLCLNPYEDHADSSYPVTRCGSTKKVQVGERTLVTPLEYQTEVCLNPETDRSDSSRPVTTCLNMGKGFLAKHDLNYQILFWRSDDYRKEGQPTVRNEVVRPCRGGI